MFSFSSKRLFTSF